MAVIAETKASALTVGARLDRIPVGPSHWRVLALVAAGLFIDVYDQSMGGGIIAALLKTGWSDLRLNGLFLSATFLGLMVGALAAGPVSDRFGRRTAYQVNLLIFGLGSLAAAAVPLLLSGCGKELPFEHRVGHVGGQGPTETGGSEPLQRIKLWTVRVGAPAIWGLA